MSTFKLKASRQVLAVAMGFAVSASALAALTSTPTGTVIGRAPVLSDVMIVNQSRPGFAPGVGDTLGLTYVFSDADGDGEREIQISWNHYDSFDGSGPTYVPTSKGEVSARVSVLTDCSITDPCIGSFYTPTVTVGAAPVGSFLGPDNLRRTHAEAHAHCQSMGARLPTVEEFHQLFVDADGGGNKMCEKYGWPQSGSCQGLNNRYWTVTDSYDRPDIKGVTFDISNGGNGPWILTNQVNVACVR